MSASNTGSDPRASTSVMIKPTITTTTGIRSNGSVRRFLQHAGLPERAAEDARRREVLGKASTSACIPMTRPTGVSGPTRSSR